MKLKTLKDIDACGACMTEHSCNCPEEDKGKHLENCEFKKIYCIHSELKKEGIKWIKHIQNDVKKVEDLQLESVYGNVMQRLAVKDLDEVLEAQITWIKMFFNIKDEETK